jgi:tRNA dimethylallyltransferase
MSILIVIGGPTATGKTGLAIALAQRLPSIILSADSRQVYREFDIGTAKPSMLERQQVPHYLIDICNPTETLTLADYQQQAQHWIQTCHQAELSQSLPLLVGGTGLYIKSVVRGLIIPRVPPQPELRSQLVEIGQPQCYAILQKTDPTAAQTIHPHDQTRTIRALEVFYTTGRPISEQQGENPPPYPILQIGLDCTGQGEEDKLTQRIRKRTQQMMDLGFVAEVERLCAVYGTDLPLLNTLGYREIKQYLQGDLALEEAQRLIVRHTRQFAKRQRTWFRADPSIQWFDSQAPDLIDRVWERVQAFLQQHGEGQDSSDRKPGMESSAPSC